MSPLAPARRVTWLDLLAVAVVTIAVFTPVFRTGFAPLDDVIMIVENTKVTEPSWKHFKSFWVEPAFRIYMPLALSTWQCVAWLTHSGTPGTPDYVLPVWGFKIVSVLTHAAAAAAAVWTLSVLTRTRWPAVVGGLIFALHPLQVESVAWTTGLKDQYCGLFVILAVGWYARHAERDPPVPWTDAWWWAALAAAVLATFSKPTAMVLPVLLLAVDWTVRRGDVAKRFVSLALFLLPAISIAIVIFAVQGNTPVGRVAPALRPLVAADSYAFYFGKLLWPTQLSIDYGRRPGTVLASGAIWWTWVFPVLALVAVLAMRSRRWVLAAVLFVVPIAPVSGITVFDMQQFSTVTDHYVYQSLAGVGLAVALLVWRWPRAGGTAAVAALCVLSVLTWRTATRWQSLEPLYADMLEANPRSWLARDLLSVFALSRGDFATARRLLDASLRDNPANGGAWDIQSSYFLQLCRYRESADAGLKATEKLNLQRLDVARRLTLLGARLKDIDLAEKGVRAWLKIEPDNRYVNEMLRSVRMARLQEKRAAATQPATQNGPPK
ncbi:MAG TPA: hypothetical protein VF595_13740 [Tepidisphaeraceae bacterium]